MPSISLPSVAATHAYGKQFAHELRAGDIVLLQGKIGSGKTTLIQGIARGFGVRDRVTSPTFVLRKRYPVRKKRGGVRGLNHVDAYRLTTKNELLGVLDEYDATSGDIWLIEWGGRVRSMLWNRPTHIVRMHVQSPTKRVCEVVKFT